MCGITGYFDPTHSRNQDEPRAIITQMMDAIVHRGPDDSGIWLDQEKGIVLGFRRLAIIDLTPTGHQPMLSANGRYVIIFNGEVYNFEEIRQELSKLGSSFRGTSDTEVMVEAFSQWGIEPALSRFNGMFAIALWDRQTQTLTLARDRIGIKPLYYGWMGNIFLFGSELKSIQANPNFRGDINRDALCLYLRHNYIPAPYSIYTSIYKLPPGTYISISLETFKQTCTPQSYWSVYEAAQNGIQNPFAGDEHQAVDQLENLLKKSIKQRMVADVPLGAFLSGGVDSSTIVALMQSQSSIPVKTFTIGFNEAIYDEAGYAREVADHLHTDHTELYVTPEDALSVIPQLPTLYDEPFSDSSQIPTYLIAKLARQHVTVSLSGDGGDELFFGYERYLMVNKLLRFNSRYKGSFAKIGSSLLRTMSSSALNGLWNMMENGKQGPRVRRTRERMAKLAGMLDGVKAENIYFDLISHWKKPEEIVLGGHEPQSFLLEKDKWPLFTSFNQTMMYLDMMTYLPDDVLCKVDRASMGVSLEARAPLLDDHKLIEFVWTLPMSLKYRDNKSKWILRQVLYRYVPASMIERPKMGFGVPIDSWLRGPLKDWAESLLDEALLKRQGFFNPAPIRQKWNEHINGSTNWQYYLWDILMFQSWIETNHIN